MYRDTLRAVGEFVEKVGVPAAILFIWLWQFSPVLADLVKAVNYSTWTTERMEKWYTKEMVRSEREHGSLLRRVGECCGREVSPGATPLRHGHSGTPGLGHADDRP